MHIMIFGATGNVGSALVRRLHESKDHVTALTRADADIRHPLQVAKWISSQRPDVVVNCTAMNGMEQCDKDPHLALLANTATPMVMARECRDIGALFIHYTTDYVFSGTNDHQPLVESTMPNPCGLYGWSKFNGEECIRIAQGFNLIFRLQSIFGMKWAGPLGVVQQALDGKGRTADDPVKVLRQWCAPTSARLVADATAHVIETLPRERWERVPGIYHLATSEPVWKRDHGEHVLNEVLGCPLWGRWHVAEGTLTVQRPVYTFLSSLKFADTFGYHLPTWREDLEACLPVLDELVDHGQEEAPG